MIETSAEVPLISVIVPTMNSGATFGQLLASLTAQSFRDFEVIVSDGGSHDATLVLAQQAAASLPRLCIDSRPDDGVYDAINRGVEASRGQWIIVLGSDDRLHDRDTLQRASAALVRSSADMVYGDVRVMARLGDLEAGKRYIGRVTPVQLLTKNICQQSIFYRRTLFDAYGLFNLRYRLWADWDFNLRVAFRRPTEWIDLIVADYAATGMSTRGTDPAYEADAPERLRRDLLSLPSRRELWPLQRRLLQHAKVLRRRRQWADAARYLGAYLTLRAQRLKVLLGRGDHPSTMPDEIAR
jgi:glycosyltransferase involved in cell wall biosynthesis